MTKIMEPSKNNILQTELAVEARNTAAAKQEIDASAVNVRAHKHHSAFTQSLGAWAYRHKDVFNSTWGNAFFNNFVRTLFAIVPYAIINMAVFHAFKPIHKDAAHDFLKATLRDRNGIIEGSTRIAFSFTAFRATNKIWNRSYHRLFDAKSADEAADALSDMPKNIMKDSIDIVPRELAATAPAAIILGSIRGALLNPAIPNKGVQANNSFARDWAANALGYAAFFPVTEGLYRTFENRRKADDEKRGIERYPGEHVKKITPSTTDTLPKILFRNAGSVLGAAVPYMATQRAFIDKFGEIHRASSFNTNLKKWLWAFEVPFAIFTSGMELYQVAYDKLAQKLEDKYKTHQVSH